MNPTLYKKIHIDCSKFDIQDYKRHNCYRYKPVAMLFPPS